MFDTEEQYRVNAFDWHAAFPLVFRDGGFDAVIGNPPWGVDFANEEKIYFRKHFENIHVRTPESFNYFVGQMRKLTKLTGCDGVIIPSSFLNQHEFWKTRKLLVETSRFSRICILGDGVFEKVTAPSCILIFNKLEKQNSSQFFDFRNYERDLLPTLLVEEKNGLDASLVGKDSDGFILQVRGGSNIIQKCYKWPALRNIAEEVATGVSSGLDKAYVYLPSDVEKLQLETALLKKLIIGGEIGRYWLNPISGKKLIYITPEIKIDRFPQIRAALTPYRDQLKLRREAANEKIPWFALNWPRRKKLFELPKILIRQTSDHIMASYDTDGWYCLKSGIIVQLPQNAQIHYLYLLGLVNSRLIMYIYDDLVSERARVFPEVKPVQLFKLPIRTIDFNNPADVKRHDRVVSLVECMLALHNQSAAARLPDEKERLERQIQATDRQIDNLVYELYGLTPDEIKIVEG